MKPWMKSIPWWLRRPMGGIKITGLVEVPSGEILLILRGQWHVAGWRQGHPQSFFGWVMMV